MDTAPTASTRPYLRYGAFAALAAFVVLSACMWHSTRIVRWERPIITAVDRLPIPFRGFWLNIFEPLPFVLTSSALAGIAAATGRTRVAVSGLVGCLGAAFMTELVFKPLVGRVRTHDVGHLVPHIVHVGSAMYPSAHVTASAAWATFAWLILGRRSRLAPLLMLIPLIIGCAVVSEELHYPADVIGGFLFGVSFTYLVVDAGRTFGRASGRRTSRSAPKARIIAS